MRDVYEFAKFFLKEGADSVPDSFDGNMKLQKLLVFADLINYAEYGKRLFDDDILAFRNGCVVEKVRIRYSKDYSNFKADSLQFEPDFDEHEYDVLNMTLGIFGEVSARELSELNHTFDFWKDAYERGTLSNGYHDKSRSVVDISSYPQDIQKIKDVIDAYKNSQKNAVSCETINGIRFFYDDFELTDTMIDELEAFSRDAEDPAYTVSLDGERLVIY